MGITFEEAAQTAVKRLAKLTSSRLSRFEGGAVRFRSAVTDRTVIGRTGKIEIQDGRLSVELFGGYVEKKDGDPVRYFHDLLDVPALKISVRLDWFGRADRTRCRLIIWDHPVPGIPRGELEFQMAAR